MIRYLLVDLLDSADQTNVACFDADYANLHTKEFNL